MGNGYWTGGARYARCSMLRVAKPKARCFYSWPSDLNQKPRVLAYVMITCLYNYTSSLLISSHVGARQLEPVQVSSCAKLMPRKHSAHVLRSQSSFWCEPSRNSKNSVLSFGTSVNSILLPQI